MNTISLVLESSPVPGVRVLAFNRPAKRNALSQQLLNEFVGKLRAASEDPSIKIVVVTGTSGCFSAGADIKEIAALDAQTALQERYLADLCESMKAVRKPILAAVEGMALGGGFEVALMCDIILASEAAKFGLPEVKIGLLPGAGGTQRLTAAVGKYRAMKIILSGTPMSATDALSMGLVSGIHEPGTVLENALVLAKTIASNSPTAVGLAKQAISKADSMCINEEYERSLYYYAFGTSDKREGVQAFLEKRNPVWN